jgi:putative membrane protein
MRGKAIFVTGFLIVLACGGNDNGTTGDSAAAGATSTDSAGGAMSAPGTSGGASSDADIFGSMTAANAAEIAAGQLAADSGSSADVKRFGKLMVTDHTQMNEAAHRAASQMGITSQAGGNTQTATSQGTDLAGQLRGKRGAEFDQAFMDGMVSSHEATLQLLDRAATTTTNAQMDSTIAQARTKVQQHLDEARRLRDRGKGSN